MCIKEVNDNFAKNYTAMLGNEEVYKHAEGGSLSMKKFYDTMERVAEDNYKAWGFNTPEEAFLHALNDPTYNYMGYYNDNQIKNIKMNKNHIATNIVLKDGTSITM